MSEKKFTRPLLASETETEFFYFINFFAIYIVSSNSFNKNLTITYVVRKYVYIFTIYLYIINRDSQNQFSKGLSLNFQKM